MLHIALCDDQETELEQTRVLVERWLQRGNIPGTITTFRDGASLLSRVEDGRIFDLFILDIIMPNESGTMIGQKLRRLSRDGVILYLTSSSEYALEAYESYPLHYLLKPVSSQKLFEALDRGRELLLRRQQDTTLVRTASGELRVAVKDILYAELHERKIQYHLCSGDIVESVSLRGSFSHAIVDLLTRRSFLLAGSSYAVNLDLVQSVERSSLLFSDGTHLILPKKAHGEFRTAWMKYWLEGGGGS